MALSSICFTLAALLPQSPQQSPTPDVATLLAAAEATFWSALEDDGSPELLQLGFERLELAAAAAAAPELQPRLRQLRQDLEEQAEMSHDTLRAAFPAYRLLRSGIRHEVMVDDPWVVAAVRSARGIADLLAKGLYRRGQYDVTGTAWMSHAGEELEPTPSEQWDLVNEAYYELAKNPRVWLDPSAQRVPREDSAYPDLSLDLSLSDFGTLAPLWFVTGTATVRGATAATGQEVRAFGIVMDRRDRLAWLVGLAVLTLAAAVGPSRRAGWRRGLTPALAAFVVGAAASASAVWVVRDWLPESNELVSVGLWAPLLMALCACVVPYAVLLRLPDILKGGLADFSAKWRDPDLGEWPAMVGGILPIVAAVTVESGGVVASIALAGWLLAARQSLGFGVKAALGSFRRALLTLLLIACLARIVVCVPLEELDVATWAWFAGGALLVVGGVSAGSAAIALLVPVVASMAVLSSFYWLAGCVALAALVVNWMPSDRGRPAEEGSARDSRARAGSTLGERLQVLREHMDVALPASLHGWRDELRDQPAPGVRLVIRKASIGYGRLLARALSHELTGSDPLEIVPAKGGDVDPLLGIRRVMSTSATVQRQVIFGGIAALAGAEQAAAQEDDAETLGQNLAQWVLDRRVSLAVVVVGPLAPECGVALDVARTRLSTDKRGADTRLHVICLNDEPCPRGFREQEMTVQLRDELRRGFLRDGLLLEDGLAELLLEATDGLSPQQTLEVLARAAEHEACLDLGQATPVEAPLERDHERLQQRLREEAESIDMDDAAALPTMDPETRRALDVAMHLGVDFEFRVVSEVVGRSPAEVARCLDAVPGLVTDTAADGVFSFTDPEHVVRLQRAGRVGSDRGAQRWKQHVLEDLRRLIEIKSEDLRSDPPGAVGASLLVLQLAVSACRGGGDAGRFGAAASDALEVVREHEAAFRARRWSLAGLLLELLDHGAVLPASRHWATALQMRLEYGMKPNRELSLEPAERACEELRESGARGPDADDLRLEIARRYTSGGSDRWSGDRRDVVSMLEAMVVGECATEVHHGRASYELGNILWRSSMGAATADSSRDYERGVELLRRSRELLSRPGLERHLVPVLQSLGDALSQDRRGEDLPVLEERVAILREALDLCAADELTDMRRVVLGTIGRVEVDLARIHARPEQREVRTQHAENARNYFAQNLEQSEQHGDREGLLKMPSSLAMASFLAGDLDGMEAALQLARERALQLGDGKSLFVAAAEFALGAARGRRPDPGELQQQLDAAPEPVRVWLRSIYSPHLTWS